MESIDHLTGLDRFMVQQKFSPLVNSYRIATVGPDGQSEGSPIAFVKQKRLKIREQVDFYADEDQNGLVLRLRAKSVFEFRGRSDVELPDGTIIGQLQKVFGKSLFRSTWEILDPAGDVVATAQESSLPLAVLRRAWGFIPVVSSLPFVVPFHFDLLVDGRAIGSYRRRLSLLDRYVMDLSGDTERRIDRRVAMAFAVALDALQDR